MTQTNPSGIVFAYRDSVWSHPRTLAVDEAGLQHGIGLDDVVGALNPNGTVLDHQELQGLYRRLGPPQHLPVVEPVGLGLPVWEYDAYRASAQFISADGRRVLFEAALTAGSAGSTAAMQAIPGVRTGVARVARLTGASASGVLGQAAAAADVSAVSGEDVVRVVPVVLVVLALLLTIGVGSLVAPLYLVATVALSFLAALGLSVAIFQLIGGELGVNFTLPFFLFIFVMALGEDYNILVMRRIREESVAWSPATAVTRAVAATGGTVTAAGLVLASTFGVLAFTTSGQIREIGTGLALGILLDTFVVRTLLVPSAVARLGQRDLVAHPPVARTADGGSGNRRPAGGHRPGDRLAWTSALALGALRHRPGRGGPGRRGRRRPADSSASSVDQRGRPRSNSSRA